MSVSGRYAARYRVPFPPARAEEIWRAVNLGHTIAVPEIEVMDAELARYWAARRALAVERYGFWLGAAAEDCA